MWNLFSRPLTRRSLLQIWPRMITITDTGLEDTRWGLVGNQLYLHQTYSPGLRPDHSGTLRLLSLWLCGRTCQALHLHQVEQDLGLGAQAGPMWIKLRMPSQPQKTPQLPSRQGGWGREHLDWLLWQVDWDWLVSLSMMGILQERGGQGGSWGQNHLLSSFKSNPHIILSIPGKIFSVLWKLFWKELEDQKVIRKFQGERNQLEEDVGFHSPLVAIQVNFGSIWDRP